MREATRLGRGCWRLSMGGLRACECVGCWSPRQFVPLQAEEVVPLLQVSARARRASPAACLAWWATTRHRCWPILMCALCISQTLRARVARRKGGEPPLMAEPQRRAPRHSQSDTACQAVKLCGGSEVDASLLARGLGRHGEMRSPSVARRVLAVHLRASLDLGFPCRQVEVPGMTPVACGGGLGTSEVTYPP